MVGLNISVLAFSCNIAMKLLLSSLWPRNGIFWRPHNKMTSIIFSRHVDLLTLFLYPEDIKLAIKEHFFPLNANKFVTAQKISLMLGRIFVSFGEWGKVLQIANWSFWKGFIFARKKNAMHTIQRIRWKGISHPRIS